MIINARTVISLLCRMIYRHQRSPHQPPSNLEIYRTMGNTIYRNIGETLRSFQSRGTGQPIGCSTSDSSFFHVGEDDINESSHHEAEFIETEKEGDNHPSLFHLHREPDSPFCEHTVDRTKFIEKPDWLPSFPCWKKRKKIRNV